MKKNLSAIILVSALMLSIICTGCAQTVDEEQTGESAICVTDMTGREVKLKKPAERIVALSAAECEILYAVGGGDKLVGRGEYCNYPEEVLEIPSVTSGSETNVEQIIALDPDLVIMSRMDQSEEQITMLENAGIAVALSTETNIEGAYKSIEVIGALTGCEEEADGVISDMKNVFAELSEKTEGKEGGTVYFEVSPLEWGLWTAGGSTYMNEIAELLGLENIFSDVTGWGEISEEQVIERDPDYIVTITMYYGEGPTPVEEIMGRAGWQDMKAVKNGMILNSNSDEIARPGPRLADAASALYEFIYGE